MRSASRRRSSGRSRSSASGSNGPTRRPRSRIRSTMVDARWPRPISTRRSPALGVDGKAYRSIVGRLSLSLRRSHRRRVGAGRAHAPPSDLLHPLRYRRGAAGRGRWPGDSRPTRRKRSSPGARRTRCCRSAGCSPRRSGCCCSPAPTRAVGPSLAVVRSGSSTRWWPDSSSSAAASNAVARCARSPTFRPPRRRCSIRRRGNSRRSPATRCRSDIAGASNRSATGPARSRSTTCSTNRCRGVSEACRRAGHSPCRRHLGRDRGRRGHGGRGQARRQAVRTRRATVGRRRHARAARHALAVGLRARPERLDARSDRGRRASDRAIRAGLSRRRARACGDPGRAIRGLQRQLHRRRHRGRRPRDEPVDRPAVHQPRTTTARRTLRCSCVRHRPRRAVACTACADSTPPAPRCAPS